MRDCVVVHPGVQHSGAAARVLDRQGRLQTMLTRLQLGDQPRWPWQQVTRYRRVERMLDRRFVRGLPDRLITRIAAQDELRRFIPSRDPNQRLKDLDLRFQRLALRRLPALARFLLLTDGSALHVLRGTAGTGLRRVLDVAHPLPKARLAAIAEDVDRYGFAVTDYDDYRYTVIHPDEPAIEELRLADKVIVASTYTAESVAGEVPGLDIDVVPYGFALPPIGPPR